MKFGLNDNAVKRIAAVAYHAKGGSVHSNVSNIYNNLSQPEHLASITDAHNTDAMQHKFSSKSDENIFKKHIAVSAAMNRGTLIPSDTSNIMHQDPSASGSEQV